MSNQKRSGDLGTNAEAQRRRNLSALLRLVHESRGLQRSTLTRLTGLNRSTVSLLVNELVDRRLVYEAQSDPTNSVGRPSPTVHPGRNALAIAVNPEVDAVTVGLVGLGGIVQHRIRHSFAALPDVHSAIDATASVIDQLTVALNPDETIVGVGVAMPGLVRPGDGLVRLAPHLGWREVPFAQLLHDRVMLPVAIANDATVGVTAEHMFGAGRGVDEMIYLNGGASGIGGGIISASRNIGGIDGYAGEFGHTSVNPTGSICECGAVGCLQTEVRRDRLLAAAGLTDSQNEDLDVAIIEGRSIELRTEVARQASFLTIALRNAINILNPQSIVFGGFLASLLAVDPKRLREAVRRQTIESSLDRLTLSGAQLGADILLVGAAGLAFEPLLSDPSAFRL